MAKTKANLISERFKNVAQIPFKVGQSVFIYKNSKNLATSPIQECTVFEIGTTFKNKTSVLFVVVSNPTNSTAYYTPRRKKMTGSELDFIFGTRQEAEDYRIVFRRIYIEKIIEEKNNQIKEIQNEIKKFEKELKKLSDNVQSPVANKIAPKKSGPFSMLDV